MIYDVKKIICIFCNESIQNQIHKIYQVKYECKCKHTSFIIEYNHYCKLTIYCIYFTIYSDINIEVFNILDDANYTETFLFDDEDFVSLLKEKIKNYNYNNIYYLSEFYNYIIKYFISYKENLLFK